MGTVVWPYKLRLPYLGAFSACGTGNPASPFSGSRVLSSSSDLTITKQDVNNRNWKKLIREGKNASTDLTVSGSHLFKYRPGYYQVTGTCRDTCTSTATANNSKGGGQWVYGNICLAVGFPSSNPTSIDTDEATNLARERFQLNSLDKQRRFTGGVFLGELHKTLHMIRSPAKNLFKSIGETTASLRKRGKLLPKHKRKEFLGNTYLEASYGWAPLVSDIQNGAEALAEYHLKRRNNTVYVRGSSGVIETLLSDVTSNQSLQYGLSLLKFRRREVDTARVEVKYYGKLLVSPANTLFLNERFWGLDLSQFAPTAWELMPYSFLIDYFTNIGNIINAWSFQSSQLYWVTKTVKRAYRTVVTSQLDEA